MTSKSVFKTTGGKGREHFTAEFKAGEYIFQEGELGRDMYIVHQGQVEILQRLGGEKEQRLGVLEKGDFFGEMAILEDMPRTASARALTDCTVVRVDAATFDQMLRGNPEIAVRMLRKLSRRLRQTDELLKQALGTPEASPSPEVPAPEPQTEVAAGPERLVHRKSGMEFSLSAGSETTLGRKDPVTGIYPDIDLTPVDAHRSVSRRHAKIYRRGVKFFVAEEIGTMNGTFINDKRLETGVPAELRPGDELRLGMVSLLFATQ